jgi:hypothetical protein
MKHTIRLSIAFIFLQLTTTLFTHNTLAASFSSADSTNRKKEESTEMKTLISSKNKLNSWGISAGIINQFGQLGHQSGLNLTMHANNKWSFGITKLQNIGSRNNGRQTNSEKPETMFTAFSVEYTAKANSLIHLSFPLLIGSISKINHSDPKNRLPLPMNAFPPSSHGRMDHDKGHMNVGHKSLGIQTGINLEMNVYKYVKIFTGINYRLALGKNTEHQLSGISGNVGLKFGLFDQKIKHK